MSDVYGPPAPDDEYEYAYEYDDGFDGYTAYDDGYGYADEWSARYPPGYEIAGVEWDDGDDDEHAVFGAEPYEWQGGVVGDDDDDFDEEEHAVFGAEPYDDEDDFDEVYGYGDEIFGDEYGGFAGPVRAGAAWWPKVRRLVRRRRRRRGPRRALRWKPRPPRMVWRRRKARRARLAPRMIQQLLHMMRAAVVAQGPVARAHTHRRYQ